MTTDIKKLDNHEIVVETTTINGKETANAFTKDQIEGALTGLAQQATAQKAHIDAQTAAQTTRFNAMLALLMPL